MAEKTVNTVNPSVVEVINVGKGLGSGVILTADGYIVTNNHVIAGAKKIQVSLANGSNVAGQLVGTDPSGDLAVVKVSGTNLPAAVLGDSSAISVGETVVAIGNPLGIKQTATEGIVSALNRTVQEGPGGGTIRRAIQTSAPINPGNSGGALVDLRSNVIGIPTLSAIDPEFGTPANGIGFAIPSNTINLVASQLIKYHKVIPTTPAALGMDALSVTRDLATRFRLAMNHGVLISRVARDGAASSAGLRAGDIVVKLASKPITSETDLLDALSSKKPGDTVSVTAVDPRGKHHSYDVTLSKIKASYNE
ncbi:MAG TPA: trypsin-like peptidase domain-containing protein [Chloroflexota bacterium]